MALQKNLTFKGLSVPEAYIKISSVRYIEEKEPEEQLNEKQYLVYLELNKYTDNTCENLFETSNRYLRGIKESGLNLSSFYNELKKLDEFTGALDV